MHGSRRKGAYLYYKATTFVAKKLKTRQSMVSAICHPNVLALPIATKAPMVLIIAFAMSRRIVDSATDLTKNGAVQLTW